MSQDELARVAATVPAGSSPEQARAALGEPLVISELAAGGETWLYVEADPARGQRESLSVAFDANGAYEGLRRKPLD
jgi:hypothetical protein